MFKCSGNKYSYKGQEKCFNCKTGTISNSKHTSCISCTYSHINLLKYLPRKEKGISKGG